MSTTALLDQMLEPFTQCFDAESAQRVVDFGIAPSVRKSVEFLAQRTNEGTLTESERADCEALIDAADFISILQLKARRKLTSIG